MKASFTLALITFLIGHASFADCSLEQLAGTWSYPLEQVGTRYNATESTDRTWVIQNNVLTSTTHLNDDFGVYHEAVITALITLNAQECTFEVQPLKRAVRDFRYFDDPRRLNHAEEITSINSGTGLVSYKLMKSSADLLTLITAPGKPELTLSRASGIK